MELTLDRHYYPAGRFAISAPGTSSAKRYVRSVRLDGTERDRTYLTTGELRSGHHLAFTLGTEPSDWGTGEHAAPPPVGTARRAAGHGGP
ncbi:Syd protein [Streptomyces sp. NBRC 110611]|nr:Syd protein [Streptomyces sp. NBRC 110611]